MEDDKGQDDKVICVPHEDPNWNHLQDLGDVPKQLVREVEHFFSIYKEPEGKRVDVGGWCDRDVALSLIEDARARHREQGAAK
jgi:inorganic pyrophosphatase